MYEVYTQQRPGRPWWALIITMILLLMAVTLALLIIQAKGRERYAPLERESELSISGRVRVKLPAGWRKIRTDDLDKIPGAIIGTISDKADERLLIIFRGGPRPLGLPSIDGAELVKDILSSLKSWREIQSGASRIGPLPAWTGIFGPSVPYANIQTHYLVRAGLSPDGQTLGILLRVPREPWPEDHALLDEISKSLELADQQVSSNPSALMSQAGIHFNPPSDATFIESTTVPPLPTPRLRMLGGQGQECWYLDVVRVPLIGQRTHAQIVEDYAITLLQQMELSAPVEEAQADGAKTKRPLARTVVNPLPDNQRTPSILIWCVHVAKDTGLLLVGRFEQGARESLSNLCEMIASNAEVTPLLQPEEIDKGRQTARAHLKRLASENLSRHWQDRAREGGDHFVARGPAWTGKQQAIQYKFVDQADGPGLWKLLSYYNFPSPAGRKPVLSEYETWSIADDLSGHEGANRRQTLKEGDYSHNYEYTETRIFSSNEIQCTLAVGGRRPASWTIAVDDRYACEPVMIELAAMVARDPVGQTAIFSTTEPFNRHAPSVLMTSLGQMKLPNPESSESALAVRYIHDYDSSAMTLYFGKKNQLLAVDYDGTIWKERQNDTEQPSDLLRRRIR